MKSIHMSFIKAYRYNGWLFEWDRNKPHVPWPLKVNYEPMARAGRKFYEIFLEFSTLEEVEQEKYRVF